MNERIDLYVFRSGRWQYTDCTRQFKTLATAERHYSVEWEEPVKARWSERGEIGA